MRSFNRPKILNMPRGDVDSGGMKYHILIDAFLLYYSLYLPLHRFSYPSPASANITAQCRM